MLHETPDRLIAYLDGELPERERAEVAAHLSGCADCAAHADRLRAATRELSRALAREDVAPPPRRAPVPRSRRGWPRRTLTEAAVLVLVLGGVAVAAIPGSPVREWISRSLAGIGRSGEQASEMAADRESPGVSVSIVAGRVLVLLTEPAPETRVRVRLVDGDRAGVRADARFRTGPGTIEVVGAGPGDVRIDLPRAADSATIRVDGRTVLIKEGADLRILAPSVDSAGAEVSFRVDSG